MLWNAFNVWQSALMSHARHARQLGLALADKPWAFQLALLQRAVDWDEGHGVVVLKALAGAQRWEHSLHLLEELRCRRLDALPCYTELVGAPKSLRH